MSRTLLKNLALLATTVAICLIVSEYGARFVFRDITTTSDNRSYFALKWKQAHVRLNSLGYREREVDPRSDDVFRVALIGDSFTFGQGIAEEERISNLLEAELRKRGRRVEVLNFGRAGYNTRDEVEALRRMVATVRPDFVVLQWFVNDVEVPPAAPSAGSGESRPPRSLANVVKMKLRNASVLYFLAAEAWHRVLEGMGMGRENDIRDRYADPESLASQRADQALLEFFRTCREHGVPVSAFLIPHLASVQGTAYPYAFLHERVLAACAREGVPCIDLRETFEPYTARGEHMKLWVNRFDPHMGALANRLAAARLLDAFGPSWTGSVPAAPTVDARRRKGRAIPSHPGV